jgi:hypothetical protein
MLSMIAEVYENEIEATFDDSPGGNRDDGDADHRAGW